VFGLFKKAKNNINVNSITVPNLGWHLADQRSSIVVYVNETESASLSVNYFAKQPDLPTAKDIEFLKSYYRELIYPNNGGLIETHFVTLNGITAVKAIFKIKQPAGMAYVASVTIPFRDFSFVVKLQAIETGVTGIRDAVLAEKLLQRNEISIGEHGFLNWFSDPYDKTITGGVLMNQSEQQQYDAEFPSHPLTIVREGINKIVSEIQFTSEVLNSTPFEK